MKSVVITKRLSLDNDRGIGRGTATPTGDVVVDVTDKELLDFLLVDRNTTAPNNPNATHPPTTAVMVRVVF
jgi:hypothetical protein